MQTLYTIFESIITFQVSQFSSIDLILKLRRVFLNADSRCRFWMLAFLCVDYALVQSDLALLSVLHQWSYEMLERRLYSHIFFLKDIR